MILPRGDWDDNFELLIGTWKSITESNGSKSAMIRCPTCQRYGTLTDHTIANDGTVSPSVKCSYSDCEFHEYVKLDGWGNKEMDAVFSRPECPFNYCDDPLVCKPLGQCHHKEV
jgi:hypothetical protein